MNNIIKGLIAGTIFEWYPLFPCSLWHFEDKTGNHGFFYRIDLQLASSFSTWNFLFRIGLKRLVGLVLNPDAIVTKHYGPILGLGVIGGIVCGLWRNNNTINQLIPVNFLKLVPSVSTLISPDGMKLFIDCLEFSIWTRRFKGFTTLYCVIWKNGFKDYDFQDEEIWPRSTIRD